MYLSYHDNSQNTRQMYLWTRPISETLWSGNWSALFQKQAYPKVRFDGATYYILGRRAYVQRAVPADPARAQIANKICGRRQKAHAGSVDSAGCRITVLLLHRRRRSSRKYVFEKVDLNLHDRKRRNFRRTTDRLTPALPAKRQTFRRSLHGSSDGANVRSWHIHYRWPLRPWNV